MHRDLTPERDALLREIDALPADMPVLVLTPRSWAELVAAEGYVASLKDPVVREQSRRLLGRMKRYAQDRHDRLSTLPAEPGTATRESA